MIGQDRFRIPTIIIREGGLYSFPSLHWLSQVRSCELRTLRYDNMNVFLLEPTHGHSTPNFFFLTSKLYDHVKYVSMSSKNIYVPEILLIASSKAKNVKNSKMRFFALKVSLISGVSIALNPISIKLLVSDVFQVEVIQVLFVAENTS